MRKSTLSPHIKVLNQLFNTENTFNSLDDIFQSDPSLCYSVKKVPLNMEMADGSHKTVPVWGTVKDDGHFFAPVGERYEVIQNHEALAFVDDLCLALGGTFTGAVSLKQGALFGVNIHLGEINLPGNDAVAKSLLIMNSFDGSTPIFGAMMPYRWYCSNQLSTGMKDEIRFSVRHTATALSRIDADRITTAVMSYYKNVEDILHKFQNKKVTRDEALKLIQALYGVSDADTEAFYNGDLKKQPRWFNQLAAILYRWESNVDALPSGLEDTVWGVFNAVNGYIQHERTIKNADNDEYDLRIVNNMFGNNHRDLEEVFGRAVQYVENRLQLPSDPFLART